MGQGIGLVAAGGVAGGYRALDEMREKKRQQQEFESLLADRMAERRMREREFEQRRKYQDEQMAQQADQRAANATRRNELSAASMVKDLAPGDVLDPTQVQMLRAGGRGGLIEQQDATLPSRSTTGYLRTGATPGVGGRPNLSSGVLRTTANAGNPAQQVFRGTRERRAMQSMLGRFPAGSRERDVLEYESATGRNAPSVFMPQPPRESTSAFQLQPIYDEAGLPSGAVRFNRDTGAVEPVDLPGAGIRAGGARGGLPVRVQNYLLQLRSKHPTFDAAQAELTNVLASAPDETFDRLGAATALRQLYAQPTGQGDYYDQTMRGVGSGGQSLLGTSQGGGGFVDRGSGPMQQPAGAITRTQLQAVAQRLGISVAEAEQQARARGLQVR